MVNVQVRNFLALLIIAAACAPLSAAADNKKVSSRIISVQIHGNRRLSDNAVLVYIRTRTGQIYNEQIVRNDRRRLLRSGRFKSVVATMDQRPDGVIVTFVVSERKVVAKIEFRGNREFESGELSKEISLSASDPLDVFTVEASRRAILLKYQETGYHFASVTVDPQALRKRNEVIFTIVEGPRVYIRKIDYEGNTFFSDRSLKYTVKSFTSPWWWIFPGGYLDMDKVRRDVEAIRAKYVNEGFLDVEVSRIITFSDDKKNVHLTFQVRENSRYVINRVMFRGNRVFSDSELAGRIMLRRGLYAKAEVMHHDAKKLRDTYGRLGYIEANISFSRRYPDPSKPLPAWASRPDRRYPVALVDLVFDLTEADQYRVGRVDVRLRSAYRYGCMVTQERIARREVSLFPGQLFNTKAMKESRSRLLDTRIFGKATIKPIGKAPNVRDALVELTEMQTANFIISVGVSSNLGLVGRVGLTQRNFDALAWPNSWRDFTRGYAWKGAGQTMNTTAEAGTSLSQYSVSWFEPAINDKSYSLSLKAYIMTGARDTYDEDRQGVVAAIGHRFKNRWYCELSSRTENIEIKDLEDDAPQEIVNLAGSNFLQGLKVTFVRDRTDSRWLPSTGDRFRMHFEQVVGDFTFEKIGADYRIFQTLHVDSLDRKHILSIKASGKQILGNAPTFERFYGGGLGSVRGFKYRGISPRDPATGNVIGGDFSFFAGTEYSYPIVGEQIRGVLFVDSGTVQQNTEIRNYRVSAGFGFRWIVPMFGPVPIRLDFGFPITKSDQDETQLLSFTMGWTF